MEDKAVKPNIRISPNRGFPSIYVEGATQIVLGFPNSRLIMHSFSEKDAEGNETRHIACEIVIPSASLIEMIQNIINQFAINKDMINEKNSYFFDLYGKIINSMEKVDFVKT